MRLTAVRHSVAAKVFLVCLSLALVVSLTSSIVLYRGASYSLREEVRQHMKSVASTAAAQIDPQVHHTIQTSADESSSNYRLIKSILKKIKKANPGMRYVYTMRKGNTPENWTFVVDAEDDPLLTSHTGDKYNVGDNPDMMNAYDAPSAERSVTEDEWGVWLSGFAPIKDSKGNTEAMIGLDMSVEHLRKEESALRRAAYKNVLTALILSVLLSLLVTRALLRPVKAFSDAVFRMRNGDLDFQIAVKGRDEISQLGDVFNQMIIGLRESRDSQIEQVSREFLQRSGVSPAAHVHAIADAFEVMTSEGPHGQAMSVEDALLELRMDTGKRFAPELVDAFTRITQSSLKKAA